MKTSPQTWRYLSPRTPFVLPRFLQLLTAWWGCLLDPFHPQFHYGTVTSQQFPPLTGIQEETGDRCSAWARASSPSCPWQANGRYRNKEALR